MKRLALSLLLLITLTAPAEALDLSGLVAAGGPLEAVVDFPADTLTLAPRRGPSLTLPAQQGLAVLTGSGVLHDRLSPLVSRLGLKIDAQNEALTGRVDLSRIERRSPEADRELADLSRRILDLAAFLAGNQAEVDRWSKKARLTIHGRTGTKLAEWRAGRLHLAPPPQPR